MVHGGLWGRIFYFLAREFCIGLTGEESFASSLGTCFSVLGSIREESSASSVGIMLDMFKFLGKSLILLLMRMIFYVFGKNLLLPYWEFALDTWNIEEESSTSLLRICFRCLKFWGRVIYFLTEDDVWHAWPAEGWFLRCLNHLEWFLMGLIH